MKNIKNMSKVAQGMDTEKLGEFTNSLKYMEKLLETIIENENDMMKTFKAIADKLEVKIDLEEAD